MQVRAFERYISLNSFVVSRFCWILSLATALFTQAFLLCNPHTNTFLRVGVQKGKLIWTHLIAKY